MEVILKCPLKSPRYFRNHPCFESKRSDFRKLFNFLSLPKKTLFAMGVWQGVAMDSLKYHQGPPCPTHRFKSGPPPRQAACGNLLHLLTPHAISLYSLLSFSLLANHEKTNERKLWNDKSSTTYLHRRMAWGVQRVKRWPQAAHPMIGLS
jgi:hypothetical protein